MSYRNFGVWSKKTENWSWQNKVITQECLGKNCFIFKRKQKVALHVACGDITDVAIENNNLVIKTSDDFLIDVLTSGIKDLENAIRWQGLTLGIEIVKFESQTQKQDKDIVKLKRILVKNLTFKTNLFKNIKKVNFYFQCGLKNIIHKKF